MAHFDLKLHRSICLNHPNGCQENNVEHIIYKLIKNDMYTLNKAFKHWYLNIVWDCYFSWVQEKWFKFVYLFWYVYK